MDKKIIRTKVVPAISSSFIFASKDDEDFAHLVKRLGNDKVLEVVFNEEKSYDFLLKEYTKFLNGGESEYFSWMYIINSKFGVVIDAHINLHCYELDMLTQYKRTFPWMYPESEKYIGDTWWFEDEEILADLEKMNIVNFLEKYRGYN